MGRPARPGFSPASFKHHAQAALEAACRFLDPVRWSLRKSVSIFEAERLRGPQVPELSFSLQRGEILMLHGPSGAGKSQALRALADMTPHEGVVRLDGVGQTEYAPATWRRLVGLVPAESGWWDDVVGTHFAEDPPDEWLARLGFPGDALSWQVSRLSSGERQRMSVLRCLALRPRVLLLDEPTANLDPEAARAMEDLITDYLGQETRCAVWVSHDPEQRQRLGAQVIEIVAEPGKAAGQPPGKSESSGEPLAS